MLKNLQDNFYLRRLHSLSGLVPIGAFLLFHLFANSTAIFSPEDYNAIINFLRSLPFIEIIEWTFIFIPLLFHGLYGIVIYTSAKPNHWQYSHLENFRYILQRITGLIAFVYIFYHIVQFTSVENLDYNYVAKTLSQTQTIPYLPALPYINPFSIYWFYVIGIISSVFHLANGLFGFCITWGLTIGKNSQRAVSIFGLLLFLAFSYLGIMTINHLACVGSNL